MKEYREIATDVLDLLGLLLLAWGVGWVLACMWAPLGPLGAAAVVFAGVQATVIFAGKREAARLRELAEARKAALTKRRS